MSSSTHTSGTLRDNTIEPLAAQQKLEDTRTMVDEEGDARRDTNGHGDAVPVAASTNPTTQPPPACEYFNIVPNTQANYRTELAHGDMSSWLQPQEWKDLDVLTSVKHKNMTLRAGDIVYIYVDGQQDHHLAEIAEIRDLGDQDVANNRRSMLRYSGSHAVKTCNR